MNIFQYIVLVIASLCSSLVHGVTNYGDIYCPSIATTFDESSYVVTCPPDCETEHCNVDGTINYRLMSSICCAAIHAGAITISSGGSVLVTVINKPFRHFQGSLKNDVKSHNFYGLRNSYFNVESYQIPNITTALPTTTTYEFTTVTQAQDTTTQPSTTTTQTSTTKTLTTQTLTTTIATATKSTTQLSEIGEATTGSFQVMPRVEEVIPADFQEQNETFSIGQEPETKTLDETRRADNMKIVLCTIAATVFIMTFIFSLVYFARPIMHFARRNRDRVRKRNENARSDSEACVCYTASNQSQQSLLNDPATCDRPCKVRAKLQIEEENPNKCSGYKKILDDKCENCTGCYNNQLIDF